MIKVTVSTGLKTSDYSNASAEKVKQIKKEVSLKMVGHGVFSGSNNI